MRLRQVETESDDFRKKMQWCIFITRNALVHFQTLGKKKKGEEENVIVSAFHCFREEEFQYFDRVFTADHYLAKQDYMS